MSLEGRLNRLSPALSPKERGILMLRAHKAQRPEDPLWRLTVQPYDYDAVDWYIKLINACSGHFASFVMRVQAKTEEAWMLCDWLLSVLDLGLQSWQLALLVPARSRPAAERALEGFDNLPIELPWSEQEGQFTWFELVDQLRERLREAFAVAWAELRAAELVAEEAAEHFDGEDPLRPPTRELLADCRRRLLNLHPVAEIMAGCKLEEPDDEWLRIVRFFVDRGKGVLK